jgi:hypothetical protein
MGGRQGGRVVWGRCRPLSWPQRPTAADSGPSKFSQSLRPLSAAVVWHVGQEAAVGRCRVAR